MWHPKAEFDFHFLFFFKKCFYSSVYLWPCWVFIACCTGSSLVEVHGLLIVVASLVAELGVRLSGLKSCGSRAGEPKLNGWATPIRLLALT